MKPINKKPLDLDSLFKNIQNTTDIEFLEKDLIYNIWLDNDVGKGSINGYQLSNNITYVEYNVIFNKDVEFTHLNKVDSIHFLYSLENDFEYATKKTRKKHIIYELQSCISSLPKNSGITLFFKSGIHYKASIISIARENVKNETLINNVINFFNNEMDTGRLFHKEYINFKILQKFRELEELEGTGTTKTMLIKGLIETVLGLQIQQYLVNKTNPNKELFCLSKSEIKIGKLLGETLKNRLEEKLTISLLSKETGKSPAKLQKIFKLLFNHTISEFITNERLKLAEQLIREKELTISEISYSVGISSRSYFSKIFKKRYESCPRSYQENFD